jgi:hypothetical protein
LHHALAEAVPEKDRAQFEVMAILEKATRFVVMKTLEMGKVIVERY